MLLDLWEWTGFLHKSSGKLLIKSLPGAKCYHATWRSRIVIDLLPERLNQIFSVRTLWPWVTDGHRQCRSDARMSLKKHGTLLSLGINVSSIEHGTLPASCSLGNGWWALSSTRMNTVEWIQHPSKSHEFLCASEKCFQNSITQEWRIIKIFITIKRLNLRKNQAEISHWQYSLFICKFMQNCLWISYFEYELIIY